jgi:hypothetical protein
LGQGLNSWVNALAVELNGDLIAAGDFYFGAPTSPQKIARWDGAAWSTFGNEPTANNGRVFALAVMGNGDIVAGGDFTNVSPSPSYVARWNGATWSSLGSGLNGLVTAMCVAPSGDLVVGGGFSSAGGAPAIHVGRWDGANWHPLGQGTENVYGANVTALIALPSGDIVAGGFFTMAGGQTVNHAALWNGAIWMPLGTGLWSFAGDSSTLVRSFTRLPTGDLVAGGAFTLAGGVASPFLATYLCLPCYANCDNSNTSPILNANDFQCFLNKFAAQDPYANCDGSTAPPLLTANDFQCFLNRFAAGCQ